MNHLPSPALASRQGLLARLLQEESTDLAPPGIPRRQAAGPVPLSFAQQRLWLLDQLEPNSALYNIPQALRLQGTLDLDVLRKALTALVGRHASLRTTFALVDGSPVQRILDSPPVDVCVIDLAARPAPERETQLQEVLREESRRPFDLARDLLLRATLVRLGGDEHVLLLVVHHIASDGWSTAILHRELSAFYEAFLRDEPCPLPELPIQYADFACWQREWLHGAVLQEQLAYWKRQLAGAPALLELPADRPRPAVQTYHGASLAARLPETLREATRSLAQQEGATLFMALLAAFAALLHRYTGQEDLVIGTPVAGRGQVETEGLIGFFVNTLALRLDLGGNPTFRALLRRVRDVTLETYSHQDLPFERLVEELQPERSPSHSPLFQVLLVLQNAPKHTLRLPGLAVQPVPVPYDVAKFDLTLGLREEEEGLQATVNYRTELFDAVRMERLLGHFATLLQGAVADPDQHLGCLPLLTEAERRPLPGTWSRTAPWYPSAICLHELFEIQTEQAPDAIALVCDEGQLTYRELNARANRLAWRLRRLGVGPEVRVALCLERSGDLVVALLAVLKAGGAYVPLDPAHPRERLALVLRDAQAPVLVTQRAVRDRFVGAGVQVLCLEDERASLARERPTNPPNQTMPENLAYVIYTSGSTGQPKGVLVSHFNVVRLFQATHPWFHFDAHDTWTLFHSYAFDFSVWELWGALLYGGRLVVVPYWTSRSPEQFHELLCAEQVTVLNQTPSAFSQLLRADETAAGRLALRLVIFGGEALEPRSLAPWFARHGDQGPQLVNMYGITETTVHVTYRPLTRTDVEAPSVIGVAIPDLRVVLLDRYLQPVPVGIPGEIFVGGDGLARGYQNRPGLTADRFRPDPDGRVPGARLYRAGDQARYRADGDLEFLGRIDRQVKLRGHRIELGEIEAVLGQHPAVREAVVLAREDMPGDTRLVAYVVPAAQAALAGAELRSFLESKLPPYMVPSAIVPLPALPLTPNQKLDHKALPPPGRDHLGSGQQRVAPRTPLERQLVRMWEDLLNTRPIGIHDNFFELGGHSLLAIRLFAQIEQHLGRRLPPVVLFQGPTIEHLARLLDQHSAPAAWSALVPIQSEGSRPPFVCVHAIDGDVLCFAELARLLGPDQPFYGIQARGLEGDQEPHSSVEAMAAAYVEALTALLPQGPYLLGGYSSGALVAYEMAQQLWARGRRVALLALLDRLPSAGPHSPGAQTAPVPRNLFADAGRWLEDFRQRSPAEKRARAWRRLRSLARRVRESVQSQPSDIPPLAAVLIEDWVALLPRERQEARRRFLEMHYRAYHAYEARPYPGRITLLWTPRHRLAGGRDPRAEAEALAAGGVDFRLVPGAHDNILKPPHVHVLAEQLRACLDTTQATLRSTCQAPCR